MFSYLLAQWRFNRSFRLDGDQYLYRRSLRSAAIPVSSEERLAFLKQFRRRYWKLHLIMFGVFIGALFALIGMAFFVADDVSETFIIVPTYILMIAFVAGTMLIDRRLFDEPAAALRDRAPVIPRRSWADVNKEAITKASWLWLLSSAAIVFALAWATFPTQSSPAWWPYAWSVYFGFCGLMAVRNVWRKLQISRSRQS